jgi:acetyl esterase/lipase
VLTAITHALLRRTVRRWFESEPDYPTLRGKLNRFVGMLDAMPGGWQAAPVGTAAGATLYAIQPQANPPPDTAPLVLYFHGGGYIAGGLPTHGAFCARLAKSIGGRVLFAYYRLAPEHPFPAAVDDGIAALRHAGMLAKGPLFIAGDSAGGGLALAVTQYAIAHAAEESLRVPDGLVLLSPWTDLTLSGASMVSNGASDSMLSMKILARMRAAYLAAQEPADRRASPIFDPNTHLPPTMLVYSATEVLRDDATRLADNLRLGGTPVTESVYPGKPHVFPLFWAVPGAGAALREMADFIKTHQEPLRT